MTGDGQALSVPISDLVTEVKVLLCFLFGEWLFVISIQQKVTKFFISIRCPKKNARR